MENQTIVELIRRDEFSLSDLKYIVYSTLEEKSTRDYDLTMDNMTCTLLFKKPSYVDVEDDNNYYYFIMEIGENSG